MPRRISRLGGTTLRRSFMTNAYSPGICIWGPRDGPQTPHRSGRPGGAVAPLYFTLTSGGPEMAPKPPLVRAAPAEPWRPSISRLLLGAPRWPPNPPSFGPPRRSRGAPLFQAAYFRLRPTLASGGAEQAAVLGHHAAVLHDTNACARQRLRRAVVADAQLEPDDRGLPRQPDDLGRVTRQELRATEDLDDVRGLAQIGEGGGDRLAEDALAGPRRVHGQHAVPARLEIRGHVVCGPRGLALGAEHRDGPCLVQDPREAGVVVHEVHSPVHTGGQPLTSRRGLQ